MAIDTSMYGMLKPLDIAGSIEKGMNLRQLADDREMRQKMIENQEKIKAARQAGITTNEDGTTKVDYRKTISELAKVSPEEASKEESAFQQRQAISLDSGLKQAAAAAQLAQGVDSPMALQAAIAKGEKMGLDTSYIKNMPYEEFLSVRQGIINQGISAEKRLQLDRDAAKEQADRDLRRREIAAHEKLAGIKAKEGEGKMTDSQSKSLGFGRRAMLSNQMLEQVENDPSFKTTSLTTQFRGTLPKWMGGIREPREQALATAKLGFIASVLRKESGAAVTPEEFETYSAMYFPQPGDSPEISAQKKTLRANFVDTEKLAAGSAWRDPIPFDTPKTTTAGGNGLKDIGGVGSMMKGGTSAGGPSGAPILKTDEIEWK